MGHLINPKFSYSRPISRRSTIFQIFSSFLMATVLPVEFCWAASILLSISFEGLLIAGIEDWVLADDVMDRSLQVTSVYMSQSNLGATSLVQKEV